MMGRKMNKEGFDSEVMKKLERQSKINQQWVEECNC
jgi:hypothetical protein